jgi:hypothetical protein
MQVFIAVPLSVSAATLNATVEKHIAAADRYKLAADRGWLIRFAGTTVELSNAIELTGQPVGTPSPITPSLIAPITGYYGRGSNEMWEWLKTRFEQ